MNTRPRGMLWSDWLKQQGWVMIADGELFPWQCQWRDPRYQVVMDFYPAIEVQKSRDKEQVRA